MCNVNPIESMIYQNCYRWWIISLNDIIQYWNPEDDSVIKDRLVTRDGIICKCCSKVFTVSEFKIHAGLKLNHPLLNLFIESDEYKTRRNETLILQDDDNDQNDDHAESVVIGVCWQYKLPLGFSSGLLVYSDHEACLNGERIYEQAVSNSFLVEAV
ncbi:increased DNA methylation 1-like isoform X2 [Tripterygium wilfordii]|uniref:increased DNA methylation 1-like isoform X2 n=1 Tax=Tripterygium wilfordii TaxID=458696 RepID=UPI0018F8154A|nr:increased DNA methylation 1-like isoform X2 [Tripterygium wilfordii]